MDQIEELFVVFCTIGLYLASAIFMFRDARRHHSSPWLWCLLGIALGPCGLLFWLAYRRRSEKARPTADPRIAEIRRLRSLIKEQYGNGEIISYLLALRRLGDPVAGQLASAASANDTAEVERLVDSLDEDVVENPDQMGDLKFSCPHCQGHLIIDERGAGLEINCTHCKTRIRVPTVAAQSSPAVVAANPPATNEGEKPPKGWVQAIGETILSGVVTGAIAGFAGRLSGHPGAFLVGGGVGYAIFISWLKPAPKRWLATLLAFAIGALIMRERSN